MSNDVVVYIGASSPLLSYSPMRNGAEGTSWVQDNSGDSRCSGTGTYAVELDAIYFTDFQFIWDPSSDFTVQAGLDGSLQSGTASSGGVSLSSTSGNHTARLEVSASSSTTSDSFRLIGIKLNTEVSPSGPGNNATLDDSASQITYSGFTSDQVDQCPIPALRSGTFYQNTISYTSSSGASASFSFDGSALYIFGPTGPSFGVFQVEIDNSVIGIYNASTTVNTYDSLLFFTTHLDSSIQHQAVLTNQVDGMMFALDYVIAVQGDSSTASGAPNGETGTTVVPVAGQTATAIIATARTAVPPGTETSIPPAAITSSPQTATAVFPSSAPAQSTVPGASAQGTTVANGNGSAGAVIGGILGGLAALVSIYIGPTSLSLHRLHLPLHISPS